MGLKVSLISTNFQNKNTVMALDVQERHLQSSTRTVAEAVFQLFLSTEIVWFSS